ncbi:ER lumen protein retaining receptor-domain-containing protein [Paraphoma chrysanthemicola]|uniref:ER lumen protein retaining receptor-domain-containing protein n=1 Tax=Paraphoma chrysanthemicola TaxID=798071 RepID=A0A8K0RGA2_9PLEO|nr:ER lumen protein retaining receptor-domain-containing protein [Paraphoma chrysanthemicola]
MKFNVFHIFGDISHTASKLILIWAIHSNSSAEGVSLISQSMYALVFCTRYLDIFTSSATADAWHTWNFTLKIFYTLSSFYIIFLMTSVYARTREREKAWKFGLYCLAGAIVLTPFWYLIFKKWVIGQNAFLRLLWVFSEILESVCVIPQLLLLRQTTVPTVIDSFYLVTLGTYRFMYVLNWIVRGANEPNYADPTSWVWGSIQTALMIDFAWVYWTRQRVKLRRGGVVDSEDLGRGWLVGRLAGHKSLDFDYDEEAAPREEESAATNKWGRRGISVSADEGVEGAPKRKGKASASADPESQPLADPAAFEDESSDEDAPPPTVAGTSSTAYDSGVRRDEWDDDVDDDAKPHDGSTK